jgi:DNA-binding CsgD family transcriptional regulator
VAPPAGGSGPKAVVGHHQGVDEGAAAEDRPVEPLRAPNGGSVPLLARAARGSDAGTALALIDAALAQLDAGDPHRTALLTRRARVLLTLDRNAEAVEAASTLLRRATGWPDRLRLTSTVALGTVALGGPGVELPPVDTWLAGDGPAGDADLVDDLDGRGLDLDARLALADYAVVQVANGDVIEGRRTATAAGQGATDDVLEVIAGIASTTSDLHALGLPAAESGAARLATALDRCERMTEVAGYAPWVALGLVQGRRGDVDRALATFATGRDVMRAFGLEWLSGLSDAAQASLLLDGGRWDDALAVTASTVAEVERRANVAFLPMSLGVRAVIEARRGDPEAAGRSIEAAERHAPRPFNGAEHLVRARSALAAARGRAGAAVQPFVALAARDDSLGVGVWPPSTLLDAVVAAVDADRADQVEAFARRAPHDDDTAPTSVESRRAARAVVERDLGQLWAAADALAPWLPYESVRLVSIAVDRTPDLDPTQRATADRSLALVQRLGATAAADRLRAALRSRSPRSTVASAAEAWALLTPTEQRVSRLVADGLSNREVADALGSSPRTVEAHLRAVFTKLDVPSRLRLAVLVRELAPADPPP